MSVKSYSDNKMKDALAKNFSFGNRLFGAGENQNKLSLAVRCSLFAIHCSLLLLIFCQIASAQEEQFQETAPPPLKIISSGEKSALEAETDVSDRTKLSLTLIENRLKKAEDFHARESFAEMFVELGGFHALIDGTLDFLNKNANGRGKVLNNFKRLEINLRRFIPRVELMRRELPAEYEFYVRNLIRNLRAARSRAVEPLFSDSVVPSEKRGN